MRVGRGGIESRECESGEREGGRKREGDTSVTS